MPTLNELKSDLHLLCDILGLTPKLGKHICPFHAERTGSFNIRQRDDGIIGYKCFGCEEHGTIVQAIAKKKNISEEEAIKFLGCSSSSVNGYQQRYRKRFSAKTKLEVIPVPRAARMDAVLRAIEEALLDVDEPMLRALNRRGIPEAVAHKYGFAFFDNITFASRKKNVRYLNTWLLPIRDSNGKAIAVKIHRDTPLAGEAKGGWVPVGAFNKNVLKQGLSTLTPAPESFDKNGKISDRWLILNPGELKTYACIGGDYDSTSVTAGESIKWTKSLIQRLAGRKVVVLWDDDPNGHKFRDSTIDALKGHVSLLRSFTLGRVGDHKIDANDYARVHGKYGLWAEIVMLRANAMELAVKPFNLCKARKELRAEIGRAIDRNGTTVFTSVVGTGKSTAVKSAIQSSGKMFAIVVPTHELGMEYEHLDGALRLVSPERASKDGKIVDDAGLTTSCPSLDSIKLFRENEMPYIQKVCSACPYKNGCAAWTQKDKVSSAKVLILQHQHLRLIETKSSYFKDRVLIIDESCIGKALRWRPEFPEKKLDKFTSFLNGFATSKIGFGHGQAVGAILNEINAIKALKVGESHVSGGTGARFMTPTFVSAWTKFLADAPNDGASLMTEFLYSIRNRQFIRRELADGHADFWMVQSAIPDTGTVLILDATAEPEAYREIFKRDVSVWPKAPIPEPQSEVIQMVDGLYPMRTLWDAGSQKPAKTFDSICFEIREVVKAKNISWNEVGLITLKALKPFLAAAFPEVDEKKLLHYGGLRGVNTLTDCGFVALIGSMHLPDEELAWVAATLYSVDVTPTAMLKKTGRRSVAVKSQEGEYDVYGRDFGDARLNLAAQLTITAEMVQAIGRARPYELRKTRQTVLIYSNMPLPMPVSRASTRADYLESLNIVFQPKRLPERILEAMTLLKNVGEFGYKELSQKMDVAETTLKQKTEYQDAIKTARNVLEIDFIRGGYGKVGIFRSNVSDFTMPPKDYILGTMVKSEMNRISSVNTGSCISNSVCGQIPSSLNDFVKSRVTSCSSHVKQPIRDLLNRTDLKTNIGMDGALMA